MAHHGAGLRKLLIFAGRSAADAEAFVRQLVRDWSAVVLGAAERAMLSYAVKLTRAPATITRDDVAALRGVGFDDRAIHDICTVAAYYAFVNRIADGLGVELEGRLESDPPSGPPATG